MAVTTVTKLQQNQSLGSHWDQHNVQRRVQILLERSNFYGQIFAEKKKRKRKMDLDLKIIFAEYEFRRKS